MRYRTAFLLCLAIAIFFSSWPIKAAPIEGDRCISARKIYDRGTELMNYEERRAAFQKAVELCPSNAEAYCNLGDALENLGLEKKKLNPDNITEGNKLLDSAVKAYEKAIQLNPGLYQAHFGLADVYAGQGRYYLAADHYRRVLRIQPGNDEARKGLNSMKQFIESETPGLKKKDEIIEAARKSNLGDRLNPMGAEDYTVKDRQSFENILFKGHSAEILPGEPMRQLSEIAGALQSAELVGSKIVIEGHTNVVPTPKGNMTLSEDRAQAVKDYLAKHGVRSERLITQHFGDTRLKFPNPTDERNRRVEIIFFQETSK